MTLLALALAMAVPQESEALQPLSAADAVALFKRVCVDPFPDTARFRMAIEAPELEMRIVPKVPGEMAQPGDLWFNRTARVGYAAADWLPRDLPSPQCTLTARLETVPDHAVIAAAVSASLNLPLGKTSGKQALQTQWNVPAPASKVRYFLTTAPTIGGSYQIRLSILNLRSQK